MSALAGFSTLLTLVLLQACAAPSLEPSWSSQIHRNHLGDAVSVDVALKVSRFSRDSAGGLRISGIGSLDGEEIGLELVVSNEIGVIRPRSPQYGTTRRVGVTLVSTGAPSERLDRTIQRLLRLNNSATLFRPYGQAGVTGATRKQFDTDVAVVSFVDSVAPVDDVVWRVVITVDLPKHRIKLNIRDLSR